MRGLVPSVPEGSLLTVIALIGTTVVPYNLFLHASTVQEKWAADMKTDEALAQSRLDTVLSVGLGGLVTIAILVNATPFDDASSLSAIASQLEPLFGEWAGAFFVVSSPPGSRARSRRRSRPVTRCPERSGGSAISSRRVSARWSRSWCSQVSCSRSSAGAQRKLSCSRKRPMVCSFRSSRSS